MLENQTQQREITMIDLFKLLAKKIKLIAWITLIALLLGFAGGVAITIFSNATYGTQAEFYIYSEESNSYILSLLRSDSFAERLLLDENGLPSEKKGTPEYEAALVAKAAVDEKLDEIKALEDEIKLYPARKDKAQRAYSDAKAKYDDLNKSWETYMGVQFVEFLGQFSEAEVNALKNERAAAKTAYDKASAEYQDIQDAIQDADSTLLMAQDELTELVAEKNSVYDVALEEFRKNPDNLSAIKNIKKYVTFDIEKTEKDGKINESSAKLDVSIAVKFDQELAQTLLDRIAKNLPAFVEESVIAEGEERETECKYLSVFGSVGTVDYKNPLIEGAKFGGIAACAAVVVVCFVVIIVDIFKSSAVAEIQAPEKQEALEESATEDENE